MIGANLTDMRDGLLGDAVVLALELPLQAAADPSQARGLVLVQARDKALLTRLINVVNRTQQESGELAGVAERQRNGTAYHVREFPAATNRPPECYIDYPDGTFAFSNSESMIQSVVDRKAREVDGDGDAKAAPKVDLGLGELARFKTVQSQLPGTALARLFIDPRHIRRLLAAQPRPGKPAEARIMAMTERYLAAVDYAGAALTICDRSIEIHSVETLDPSLLDPWLRRWAGDPRPLDKTLSEAPASALAIAFGHVDATVLLDALAQIMGDEDHPRLTNLETLLTGLMLGLDLRTKVLPRLGPGVLAYLDAPSETDEQGGAAGSTKRLRRVGRFRWCWWSAWEVTNPSDR